MLKKNLFVLTMIFIIYNIMVGGVGKNSDLSKFKHDPSQIYNSEWSDTSLILHRPQKVSLEWIFQKMVSLQRMGREHLSSHHESYLYKLDSGFISSDIADKFIKKTYPDTIFIREVLNKDGSYSMSIWNSIDSIYMEPYSPKLLTVLNPLNNPSLREYEYISSWKRAELQEYGRVRFEGVIFCSNHALRCVTRIILKPKTIQIDMFKYYPPLWPEDRINQRAKKVNGQPSSDEKP